MTKDKKRETLITDVSGVILAGGENRRFGKNKALARICDQPLIERVVSVMSSIFEDLVLITNTPEVYSYLHIPLYKDEIEGCGPLGGILTGLIHMSCNYGFFAACDMPCLKQSFIRHMVYLKNGYDVVVPRIAENKIEPLHAIYAKACIPFIRKSIKAGSYRISCLFRTGSARYIDIDEICRFDPGLMSFINVNTEKELKSINQLLHEEQDIDA